VISVRAMAAQDLDQVLLLEGSTSEAPHWNRAVYEGILLPDANGPCYAALVAMDGENLAGFAVARQIVDVCELESIVIDSNARRKGIATRLLDELFTWARTNNATRVQLEVRAGNKSAIRFYENAGLVREGLRRGYYHSPDEDAILMAKSLYSRD
jgi:[ribosomal protein S18]-alanine N-acetyltransferase